jgi:hypothetical protein
MHLYLKGAFTFPAARRPTRAPEMVRAFCPSSVDTPIIRNDRCSLAYLRLHGGGGNQV